VTTEPFLAPTASDLMSRAVVTMQAVIDGHAHSLIVVDEQHRPVGTVSCLDVLAALARPVGSAAGD
jgi:CBS-domain-containing membrane protein